MTERLSPSTNVWMSASGAFSSLYSVVFPVVLGMDERSRYIHLDALLMGQGMLEVKVERRRVAGCVVVDVRIDGLRAARCPHLVQLILVGALLRLLRKMALNTYLSAFVRLYVRFRLLMKLREETRLRCLP